MAKILGFFNLLFITIIILPLFALIAYYFLLNNFIRDYEESYNTLGYIADDIISDIKTLIKNNLDKEITIRRNSTLALISVYDVLNDSKLSSSRLSNDIANYTNKFFIKYTQFYGLSNSSLIIPSINDNPEIFFTNSQRQRTYFSGTNIFFDFFGNNNTTRINISINYNNRAPYLSRTCRFNNVLISCNGGNFGTGFFNVTLNYTDDSGNSIFNFFIDPTITNNFTITYASSPTKTVTLQIGKIATIDRSLRFFINNSAFATINATFINNEQNYIMAYIPGNLYLKQVTVEKNITIIVLEEG
jgi:hypothetical protein